MGKDAGGRCVGRGGKARRTALRQQAVAHGCQHQATHLMMRRTRCPSRAHSAMMRRAVGRHGNRMRRRAIQHAASTRRSSGRAMQQTLHGRRQARQRVVRLFTPRLVVGAQAELALLPRVGTPTTRRRAGVDALDLRGGERWVSRLRSSRCRRMRAQARASCAGAAYLPRCASVCFCSCSCSCFSGDLPRS